MTKYEEIIANLRSLNPNQAEQMEEEIDIIIHKLKFLPKDSFPTVVILNQKNNFTPVYNSLLAEKVKIAGGNLTDNMEDNPQVIIIIQDSNTLYQVLPTYLSELKSQKIRALIENKIYIIQGNDFSDLAENYVRDTEILAEIIQSKYFFYGRDGEDWVKFDLL
ncbi:ABC transporter substrate-binding protein [Sphingobacterium rhinopitheci]|uniref:ABC transporter substrate-binding protein n=1 Tax=Sphingobacterium rhinopitheci TaxID=2781960 RepID=UPI001F524F0A|nr:ABC transporter substrate-binding protein [Sphingobacterium rhinopitheci]MCI0920159.1 ABC transporter substrate-binding protein [Sphingobacterium rhinopitheci]